MDIPELIRNLAGNSIYNNIHIYQAIVDEIHLETRTVNVTTISGAEISSLPVTLMTEIGDGSYYIPVVGSVVYILVNPTIDPFIIHYGEIQGVVLASSQTINIGSPKIELNGDDFGGLVKVEDLVTKINKLENALNSLITLYNAHIHPVSGAVAGPTSNQDTDIIQITVREDLENPDITHSAPQ